MHAVLLSLYLVANCFLSFAHADAKAPIPLGLAVSLTGPTAKYGIPIKNGFLLAEEMINKSGGINGTPLQLIIQDEQGKKEEAINVFKKLIFGNKVWLMFGPTLSNSAFATDPLANASKVVVFGTSNTAEGITAIGPYVFRNSVMESDVLPVTVRAAVKHYNIKKVAILYGNDDAFTKSGYDVFKTTLNAQNIPITNIETYAKGDVDFNAQLTNIKAATPDAIICSCMAEEAANIMVQARRLGLTQPFIGGNGLNSPKLFEIAQKAGEGAMMASPWSAENPSVANQTFITAYQKKFNSAPDQFAAQAYDALNIVAAALKKITVSQDLGKNRLALKETLPSITIEGATGHFAFRSAQIPGGKPAGYDAEQQAQVRIAKEGKFQLLTPAK